MVSDLAPPPPAVDELSTDALAVLDQVAESQPKLALALARTLETAGLSAPRAAANRLLDALASDARLDADIDEVAGRAARAQRLFENWTEDRVDALLFDLAETFAWRAEVLAVAAVAETGMGNVRDKTIKNRFASLTIYESLAGKVAQGRLSFEAARQVTEVAGPVGVVFAIVPATSPAATAIFKTLIAVKGRNALILSFHHNAHGVGRIVSDVVRVVLTAHGAPADLVQCLPQRADRKMTRRFMSHPKVSLILATGGAGMVKAAYSSGKPAIGIGPGNAPAWICADTDLDRAAHSIVTSKAFDNGLICGAEHNLVVDERIAEPFAEALKPRGAAIVTSEEERLFQQRAIDAKSGTLRRELVGQTAQTVAAVVGIERAYPIRLLVIPVPTRTLEGFNAGEKLAPVLSMFAVPGVDAGLALCRALLKGAGGGHTAIIHSTNAALVERFARAMPAGRILVNAPGAQGCCGMTTGLDRSLTLGCGTFGGNSTTDNVSYRHLLNIKRVAYGLE